MADPRDDLVFDPMVIERPFEPMVIPRAGQSRLPSTDFPLEDPTTAADPDIAAAEAAFRRQSQAAAGVATRRAQGEQLDVGEEYKGPQGDAFANMVIQMMDESSRGPSMVPVGSATTQVTSAPLSGMDVVTRLAQMEDERELLRQSRQKSQESLQEQAKLHEATLGAMRERDTDLKGAALTLKRERDQAVRAASEAQASLKNNQVDPDRMWRRMPAARKAVAAVAAALGGFTEGFTQGRVKDKAIPMLNAAIERDVMAQRAEFQQKLQFAQMAEGTKRFLMQRYDANQEQQRQNLRDITRVNLMKMAVGSEDSKQQQQYVSMLNQMGQQEVALKGQAQDRVTRSTTRQIMAQLSGPQRKALKEMPDTVKKEVGDTYEGVQRSRRLIEEITSAGDVNDLRNRAYKYLAQYFTIDGMERIRKSKRDSIALALAVAMQGSRPTDKDVDRVIKLVPSQTMNLQQLSGLHKDLAQTWRTKLERTAINYQNYNLSPLLMFNRRSRDLHNRLWSVLEKTAKDEAVKRKGKPIGAQAEQPTNPAVFGFGR